MDLTTKNMWTVSDHHFPGFGGAQLLAVAKLGSGTGESMAAAVVLGPGDWGVADQVVGMSFDTTASNTGRRKRGLCPHRTENGERTCCFRLGVTISWSWWYMRCSPCFLGVPHRPSICSSNASKPHGGASTERTSARESWWRKWRLF
ncbi:hypothetical protein GWK47_003681 [Chionoecetes opilio]|uniref:Uncharacterized protein n=1 Tax=Chionoecetes opilio TaxID=41210 RepID=A0A8J4YQJ2_CHIOP|nr:hypothetical protein GWK47_003681 [Chionoecetes opilio]